MRSVFGLLVMLACLVLASGCTAVKPYQRGRLASPVMQADTDPLGAKLDSHVWEYRESSIGGAGVGGGGCGCN